MKKVIVGFPALVMLSGCVFAARSPEAYRDETGAVLATKNEAIRACYDGVLKTTPGAQGTVSITFEVETQAGKIINVAVDPASSTAPAPVQACVTQNLDGLALTPPDQRRALGRWIYQFAAPATAGAAPPPPGPAKT